MLGDPGPHFGAILIGGAAWLGVVLWRWAWRWETRDQDHRVVLIDRRRGCVVSIEPGREESEVSLAHCYSHCREGPAGQWTSELVMECGDQEVRFQVWKDRGTELRQAIKGYWLNGDLPLSRDELRRLQTGGSPLRRSLRDALWRDGYRRAWVERPVWTVWQHLLWPVFTAFTVFHALAVASSLRVNPVPALPARVLQRLGPVRRIEALAEPEPAEPEPEPDWPDVRRAVSKGLLYVMSVVPVLGVLLVFAALFWVTEHLPRQAWEHLRPFQGEPAVWMGLAAFAVWVALCVLLNRNASWEDGGFWDGIGPVSFLVSTLMFPIAVLVAALLLDTLNVAADKGPAVAQFRGRVVGFDHWVNKGKGGTRAMTSLRIAPTRGLADTRPIELDVGRKNVRMGDELCAEVYPGHLGRPWLSRLRDCSEP